MIARSNLISIALQFCQNIRYPDSWLRNRFICSSSNLYCSTILSGYQISRLLIRESIHMITCSSNLYCSTILSGYFSWTRYLDFWLENRIHMITRSSFNLYCSTILSGYQISRLLVFENRCSNATVIPATNPRAIRGMLLSGHRGSFSRRPPRSINRGIFIDGTRTRICGLRAFRGNGRRETRPRGVA